MHLWLTWKRGQHCFPPWSSWCQLSWINVWKMPWVHKIKEALDDLVFAEESHNLLAVNAKVFETLQSPSVKCREVLSFSEKWRDNSLYSGLMLESEEDGSLSFLCERWIIHLKSTPVFSLGGCDKWQLFLAAKQRMSDVAGCSRAALALHFHPVCTADQAASPTQPESTLRLAYNPWRWQRPWWRSVRDWEGGDGGSDGGRLMGVPARSLAVQNHLSSCSCLIALGRKIRLERLQINPAVVTCLAIYKGTRHLWSSCFGCLLGCPSSGVTNQPCVVCTSA